MVEVEAEPLGEARRLGDRLGVFAEALGRPRRARPASPAPLPRRSRLGRLERPAEPDARPARPGAATRRAIVGVDVAGRHAGHPEQPGELGEPAVAGPVAAPERPLQLDPEAIGAEGREQRAGRARSAPRAVAAGDPARPARRRGRSPRGRRGPRRARSSVGRGGPRGRQRVGLVARGSRRGRIGEQPAEVAVAGRVGDEQRQVEGAGRAVAAEAGRGGEREPASASTVSSAPVIGRTPGPAQACANSIDPQIPSWSVSASAPWPSSAARSGELVRARGPVEEREGRVGVELDVAHRCSYQRLRLEVAEDDQAAPVRPAPARSSGGAAARAVHQRSSTSHSSRTDSTPRPATARGRPGGRPRPRPRAGRRESSRGRARSPVRAGLVVAARASPSAPGPASPGRPRGPAAARRAPPPRGPGGPPRRAARAGARPESSPRVGCSAARRGRARPRAAPARRRERERVELRARARARSRSAESSALRIGTSALQLPPPASRASRRSDADRAPAPARVGEQALDQQVQRPLELGSVGGLGQADRLDELLVRASAAAAACRRREARSRARRPSAPKRSATAIRGRPARSPSVVDPEPLEGRRRACPPPRSSRPAGRAGARAAARPAAAAGSCAPSPAGDHRIAAGCGRGRSAATAWRRSGSGPPASRAGRADRPAGLGEHVLAARPPDAAQAVDREEGLAGPAAARPRRRSPRAAAASRSQSARRPARVGRDEDELRAAGERLRDRHRRAGPERLGGAADLADRPARAPGSGARAIGSVSISRAIRPVRRAVRSGG